MIIDSHAHLGYDCVFDVEQDEEELLAWMDRCGVDGAVVQPFVSRPYIRDIRLYHDRIAALCQRFPGRFWGMASINPHLYPDEYDREAERCVHELGFVAIKITPIAHAVRPDSPDGRHAFDVALSLGVPLMVHTGSGGPFADAAGLWRLAPEYPDLPILLAHAGGNDGFAQALCLAQMCPNVYLEPSWLNIMNLMKAEKTIGAERLLFSADHACNLPVELAKYRVAFSGKALEAALSGAARKVFALA